MVNFPWAPPLTHGDQSNPWNIAQQTSCFSSITAIASALSKAALPLPPLLV